MLSVELTRGSVVESTHLVRACVADDDGGLVGEASPGDGEWPTFLRSAAKPLQAAPGAAAGVIERLGLDQRHLAVACASHLGSPEAVGLVGEILDAVGVDERSVLTGDDGHGGRLAHQCSGNHAFALAYCVVERWPTDTYLEPSHPVQQAMQNAVAATTGVLPELGRDNCGMPTHLVSLKAMATAYARLGSGWDGVPGLDLVGAAMALHPEIVQGSGHIDTELMCSDERLMAKIGAEALLGIGSTVGLGVAIRVVDGGNRARGPAGVACARRWLGLDEGSRVVAEFEAPTLVDSRGAPIGDCHAVWDGIRVGRPRGQ